MPHFFILKRSAKRTQRGLNDAGEKMAISPDPLLEELQQQLQGIELGHPETVGTHLQPILSSERIFGINLYKIGLGGKIERYFKQLIQGPGSIRETLHHQIQSL